MPMPIRPVGDLPSSSTSWKEDNNMFGLDLDALVGAATMGGLGRSAAMSVTAEATDRDASTLLDLWSKVTVVSDADSAEDKKYAIPSDFPSDSLMRLKAASLVHGSTNIIQFTPKAARVIKTIVLSEQNAYSKKAVSKPYSMILAEAKAFATSRSTLAFQRTASLNVEAQRNIPIEPGFLPLVGTPWESSRRIINTSGGSNKQYIVRVFSINGRYVILAWNGSNISGRGLTLQPKGTFSSASQALAVRDALLDSKMREGYRPASEINHPDLLGTSPERQSSPTTNPTEARPRGGREDRNSVFDTSQGRRTERPVAPPAARSEPAPAPVAKPATKSSPATKKEESVESVVEMPTDEYIDEMLKRLEGEDRIDFET